MVYHEGQGYRAQAQAMPGVPGCTAIEARIETVGTLHWQYSPASVTAATFRRRLPTCRPRVRATGPTSLDDLTLLNFPRASTVNRPDPCCCSSFFFLTNNSTHIVNCRYQTPCQAISLEREVVSPPPPRSTTPCRRTWITLLPEFDPSKSH